MVGKLRAVAHVLVRPALLFLPFCAGELGEHEVDKGAGKLEEGGALREKAIGQDVLQVE